MVQMMRARRRVISGRGTRGARSIEWIKVERRGSRIRGYLIRGRDAVTVPLHPRLTGEHPVALGAHHRWRTGRTIWITFDGSDASDAEGALEASAATAAAARSPQRRMWRMRSMRRTGFCKKIVSKD